MKLLFSAVRNEAPFLMEWIAYHRAIGFDRVVICSNDSDDGTTELLDALDRAGEVRHLANPVPDGLSAQASAARVFNAAGLQADGDWVLWLDADEFLNIHAGEGRLDDLIAAIGGRTGMIIPWRIFGDGGNEDFPGQFISDHFQRASGPEFARNFEVKTLYRIGPQIAGFAEVGINRPLIRPRTTLTVDDFLGGNGRSLDARSRMNQIWLRGKEHRRTCRTTGREFGWDLAQINHYLVRTRGLFALKKLRGRGWQANATGAANDRHTPVLFDECNRNDHEDRSILRFQPAVDSELARLRKVPGLAEIEQVIQQRLEQNLERVSDMMLSEPTEPVPDDGPKRFDLTLPAAEAELVRRFYQDAGVILEYGSGGSTFLAADLARTAVYSVESDADWAKTITASIAHHFPDKAVHIHYADIGPTKEWGVPVNGRFYGRWPGYPISVWDRADFQHPDVILIDGRFRPACWLTAQFRITRPTTVLFDDYIDRKKYHHIEQIAKPVEIVGRMARFDLKPMPFPVERLDWIIRNFLRPN